MKWIGQHIWDFISRFRTTVYLENLETSSETNVLVVDSDGKVTKNSSASGDITGITITTDSGGGSAASDTSGSADFSILGSSGVGVTNSGTTITAVSVPGEIDHDSLLNFASNEHFTQANIVATGTIASGTWQGTAIASAYLDADTAHLTTDQTFTGIKQINVRKFTMTSSTDNEYNGDITYAGSGTTTLGNVVYMRTDGQWGDADADVEAASSVILGIALGTDPSSHGILLRGMFTAHDDIGNDQGVPIYLSPTAGNITATAPSASGQFVRIIGYNLGDDDQMWFNPDSTYIEIA